MGQLLRRRIASKCSARLQESNPWIWRCTRTERSCRQRRLDQPSVFHHSRTVYLGNEPRVDSLQASGIDNWDFAAFKHTAFGPDQKLGFEFRVEFFNTFNRVQFIPPSNTTGQPASA